MATQSWSSRVRMDSDAVYWEWRDELITKLGLLLGVDETNITPGAGARPAVNTEQGYAVFHLNDSLHATAPIYLRFGFGTGNGASIIRLSVTVGTTTDGSGVIGGQNSALRFMNAVPNGSTQTSNTARQSYACAVEGFFGIDWKVGGTSSGTGAFFVCRTCDSDGVPTVTGALAAWAGGSANATLVSRQSFRYAATADTYTAQEGNVVNCAIGLNPLLPTNTAVGADIQVFLGWTITPRSAPLFGVCGCNPSELTAGGTFSATLVGATPRTYLTMSPTIGPLGPIAVASTGGLAVAMLWE